MKYSSLLALAAAITLAGAGCASSTPATPAPAAPQAAAPVAQAPSTSVPVKMFTLSKESASGSNTCSVKLSVPHVDLSSGTDEQWINDLIDANVYGMLESLDTDTLEGATDAYLANCVEELAGADAADISTNPSIDVSGDVSLNKDGLFSILLTTKEKDYDGIVMTYAQGDLYDVKDGEELTADEVFAPSQMSTLYKALFTHMSKDFASFLADEDLAKIKTVAASGDETLAKEFIDPLDLEYVVHENGIEFVFAQESWVPFAQHRVGVTLPWSEIDPLLTAGTALANWR